MNWFKGTSTGDPEFRGRQPCLPVDFPLNPFIDTYSRAVIHVVHLFMYYSIMDGLGTTVVTHGQASSAYQPFRRVSTAW